MIQTLASLALDAGHDITARPEVRFVDVAKESDIPRGLIGYGPTDTGLSVTEQNALSYIPVLACTRVISETWACCPLKLFKGGDNGPETAKNHYLYPILHDRPNPEMSAFAFWEAAGVSLCLYNNFYAEIEWDGAGRARYLWPLPPNRVEMRRVGSRLVYDVHNDTSAPNTVLAEDMLHIVGCLQINGILAESLIKHAREAIGLGLAPQKFAANFYRNNARPGIYLSTPNSVGKDKRAELAESWNNIHAGIQGAGRTGVLEGGMEIKTVGVTQSDAEFTQTREFQLLEACRIYRVPPHMIADLSRATFSNIEHQDIAFAKHTMTPYCRRAEQALNMRLVGIGTGYYAEFNMDGLMRGDLLSRTQAYAQAINTAQITPNEARNKENRGAVEGGDKLYIQGANVPLDMAGKQLEQKAPKGTPSE
jgi:HK97 family phage portal protein